jgi:hypothetical protein
MPIRGNILYNFKWYFRPISVPIVQLVETAEVEPNQISGLLAEINDRQWAALEAVLLEAKFKAESMLRDERIMNQHGQLAYYQGWIQYADYVIASLEGLRSGQAPAGGPSPGPDTRPIE